MINAHDDQAQLVMSSRCYCLLVAFGDPHVCDSCPCYWHLVLPVGNPLLQSPAAQPSSSSAAAAAAPLVWYSERAVCSLCNFTLVYYGADIRGEMNSVSCMRVCLPPASLRACVRAGVRSQHMLSRVCGGASRACDAVRAG